MQAVRRTFSELSNRSKELAPEVDVLRGLVKDAWKNCIVEYFQVVAMRVVDPQYSYFYFNATLHDSVEFTKFCKELNNEEFQNRQIWRAWTYIRPLVVKYVGEQTGEVERLDRGLNHATWFRFDLILRGFPEATFEKERPNRKVTEEQWDQTSELLNELLDEAILLCGYKKENESNWVYKDVFTDNPQRLNSILALP